MAFQEGHWSSRLGAWLAIGTSPAALAMGADIAGRHQGPPSLIAVALGAAVMGALLYPNGVTGVLPPYGQGAHFAHVLRDHLGPQSRAAVYVLMALAMMGWFGFAVGLGGAALNALLSLPAPAGQLLLAAPLTALAVGGIARWNRAAVLATTSSLLLAGAIALLLARPEAPVTVQAPRRLGADLAAYAGYVAGFGVRASDFTAGLRTRRDLVISVAMLVGTTVVVSLIGVALQNAQGTGDVVAALAAPGGLPLGNALLAMAVVAPALTNLHSGALSLQALMGARRVVAVLSVAVPGALLGVMRFDRELGAWLGLLAGVMPPLLIPLAVAGARVRRGHAPERLPLWTWLPASVTAGGIALAGAGWGIVAGLGLSGVSVALWRLTARRTGPTPGQSRPDPSAPPG